MTVFHAGRERALSVGQLLGDRLVDADRANILEHFDCDSARTQQVQMVVGYAYNCRLKTYLTFAAVYDHLDSTVHVLKYVLSFCRTRFA